VGAVTEDVLAFVEEARRATGEAIETYDVDAFGDSAEEANELAALVLHGPKRATTGMVDGYAAEGEALPVAGSFNVVIDADRKPVCLIRTREVTVRPFREVDGAFAWDEGEGDRSLRYWREAHRRFFGRSGLPFAEDSLVVCERFDLIYPLPSNA
jgi:uncharacterized protein YhfF